VTDRELFLERTSSQYNKKTTVERWYLIQQADGTLWVQHVQLNADGEEAAADFIVHVADALATDDEELCKQLIVTMDRRH